jgi:hypothetical protein
MRLLICILLFPAHIVMAQHAAPQWDVIFPIAFPLGEFKANSGENEIFYGFGTEISLPIIKGSPLRAGGTYRYMVLAGESKSSTKRNANGDYIYDVAAYVGSRMTMINGFLRFDPMNVYDYPVLPYMSFFMGYQHIGIRDTYEVEYEDNREDVIEVNRQGSRALSYGFDLGVNIRITEDILFDLSWQRTFGTYSRYIDASSIEISDEYDVFYNTVESRTDMGILSFSLVWDLWD